MRWLRTGKIDGGTYTIERCTRCIDPAEESVAIDRYLHNWLVTHPASPEVPEEPVR